MGSRGPLGLVGCGITGTAVLIGAGVDDVAVEYTDIDGAGEPVPYWGYADVLSTGTTLSPYPLPPREYECSGARYGFVAAGTAGGGDVCPV